MRSTLSTRGSPSKSVLFLSLLLAVLSLLSAICVLQPASAHSSPGSAAHGHAHDGAACQHDHSHGHAQHSHHHGAPQKVKREDEAAKGSAEVPHGHSHSHSHAHGHAHHHHPGAAASQSDSVKDAFMATIGVTLMGNAGLVIFLFTELDQSSLRLMVAFAVGGLLGDVFLHILPHANEALGPAAAHDGTLGYWTLCGIFVFYALEKIVQSNLEGGEDESEPAKPEGSGAGAKKSKKPAVPGHGHAHGGAARKLEAGAILNLIADTAHNFIDGMALASAFRISPALGRSTTLAVFLHEVPHEMGDFAVLIANGFTKTEAFGAQFVSAVGALAGCAFGAYNSFSGEPVVALAFTAGAFIYVALVDILPELIKTKVSRGQAAAEGAAACMGVGLMALIAHFEPGHAH